MMEAKMTPMKKGNKGVAPLQAKKLEKTRTLTMIRPLKRPF
ncbi:MAG: hypothetical protein WCA98_12295 [Candidatus Acidiferrales bacterium]